MFQVDLDGDGFDGENSEYCEKDRDLSEDSKEEESDESEVDEDKEKRIKMHTRFDFYFLLYVGTLTVDLQTL